MGGGGAEEYYFSFVPTVQWFKQGFDFEKIVVPAHPRRCVCVMGGGGGGGGDTNDWCLILKFKTL